MRSDILKTNATSTTFKYSDVHSLSKMNRAKLIEKIAKKSIPILKENGVVAAGIFGSFARGEGKKHSDIDFLIKFHGKKSLLDLVGLKIELEHELGKKVDILTYKSIHPLLKESILQDEVRIL